MAKRTQHTIGLDIGTSKVTCIAGEPGEGGLLEVVGIGEAEARGLRKGVIVNPDAAVDAIKKAVEDAERMSGLEAEEVTINLAGSHILGFNGQAIVAVSGRDREIVAEDVRRAIDSACAIQLPAGREIVDRLPQEFIVDDQDGINDPVGMIGARLAVKVHIVTSPVTARQNAINAVNRAGLVGCEEDNHIRERRWRDPAARIGVRHIGSIGRRIDDRRHHAIHVDALLAQLGAHAFRQANDDALPI